MTTCPVQKFGLAPVLEEYIASGEILGKGTEALEGYKMFGKHWSVGERPPAPSEVLREGVQPVPNRAGREEGP